jgi:hypothetical protein
LRAVAECKMVKYAGLGDARVGGNATGPEGDSWV